MFLGECPDQFGNRRAFQLHLAGVRLLNHLLPALDGWLDDGSHIAVRAPIVEVGEPRNQCRRVLAGGNAPGIIAEMQHHEEGLADTTTEFAYRRATVLAVIYL